MLVLEARIDIMKLCFELVQRAPRIPKKVMPNDTTDDCKRQGLARAEPRAPSRCQGMGRFGCIRRGTKAGRSPV